MQKRTLVILALFSAFFLHASIWHVSSTGSDAHSGRNWTDAFGTLEHALSIAGSGDEIRLAAGRYEPAISSGELFPEGGFILKSGVSIRGGFFGCENSPEERHRYDRDGNGVIEQWEFAGETILRLPTATVGTILDGAEEAVVPTLLEGLTVIGGDALGSESSSSHPGQGGGAFLRGKYEIVSCEFIGNRAVFGGAVNLDGAVTVSECLFATNDASSQGGAIFLTGEGALIYNCVFQGNGTADNTRIGGAIASSEDSMAEITFCTFVGNGARDAGSTLNLDGQITLRSSVVWDTYGHIQGILAQENCIVENCAANAGGFPGTFATGGILLGDENEGPNGVDFNDNKPGKYYPCFADITNADYRLAEGSGLIKRGSQNGTQPAIDAAGDLREGTPSVGAYTSTLPRNAAVSICLNAPLYYGLSEDLDVQTDIPLASMRLILEKDDVLNATGTTLTANHAGTTRLCMIYHPADDETASGLVTLEVTTLPRPVKIVADDKSWVLEEEEFPELTWTMTSGKLINGDSLSGELTALPQTRGTILGKYPIRQGTLEIVPQEHADDYVLTFQNGVLTILEADQHIVAEGSPVTPSIEIYYGDPLDGSEQLQGEFEDSQTGEPVSGVFQWTRDGEILPSGTYDLEWTFIPDDDQYPSVSGVLTTTVQKRPIVIRPTSIDITYGDPIPVLTYMIEGDATQNNIPKISPLPTLSVKANSRSSVGVYPILVSIENLPNYTVSVEEAFLTIAPRSVSIQVDDANKAVGDPDPTFTWHYLEGIFLEGDETSVTISRTPGEAVGEYPLLAELTNSNYTFTANDAVLTICKAVPKISEINTVPLQPGECLRDLTINYSATGASNGQTVPGKIILDDKYDLDTPLTLVERNIDCQFIPDDTESYIPVTICAQAAFEHQALKIQIDDKTITYGEPLPDFTYTIQEGTILPGSTLLTNLQLKYPDGITQENLPPGTYTICNGELNYDSTVYDYCYEGTQFLEGKLTVVSKQVYLIVDDKEYQGNEPIPQFTSYFSHTEDGSEPVEEDLFSIFTYEYQTSEPDENGVSWITVNGSFANDACKFTVVPGKLTCHPTLLTPVWPDLHKLYGEENPVVTISARPEELPEGTTSFTANCQIEFLPEELNKWQRVQSETVTYSELPGRHTVRLVSSDTGDYRFQWDTSVTGTLVIGAEEILINKTARRISFYGTTIGVILTDYQGETRQRDFTYGVDILADLNTALLNVFEGGTIWIEGGMTFGDLDENMTPPHSCTIRKNYTTSGDVIINSNFLLYDLTQCFTIEGLTLNRNAYGFNQLEARDCIISALYAQDCTRLSLTDCLVRYPQDTNEYWTCDAIDLRYSLPVTSTEFEFQNVTFNWVTAENNLSRFNIYLMLGNLDCSAEAREYLTNWPVDLTSCTFQGTDEDLTDILPTHFFPEAVEDDKTYFLLP